MKILEITQFNLQPYQTHGPVQLSPDQNPVPQTPHITLEFTYPELRQIAKLVRDNREEITITLLDDALEHAILNLANEAGLFDDDQE